MRRRLNYANLTATLALFFAMSGGALAAKHYLVNSTKQISPKVLRALKGNAGAKGAAGATGATGAAGKEGSQGKEGQQGKEGAAPATLPTGHSESGTYAVAGGTTSSFAVQGFAFPLPLASALDSAHVALLAEGSPTSNCPGVGRAANGFLCVYERVVAGLAPDNLHAVNSHLGQGGADTGGFMLFFDVTSEDGFSYGSWTVTGA